MTARLRSALRAHACAVDGNGALWCWGSNQYGQLGDATTTGEPCGTGFCRPTPAKVTALGNLVVEVATGVNHSCAVTNDGTLWCWGDNGGGQLGDGNSSGVLHPSPLRVAQLGTNVAHVAAGGLHTCALLKDGALWCWGSNFSGELGDGTQVSSSVPVRVPALGTNVAAIRAGGSNTCALLKDGTAWCWGAHNSGQTGDCNVLGTARDGNQPFPVQVHVLGANVIDISVNANNGCAVKDDGSVWCWGLNDRGQVGDGTTDGILCGRTEHCRFAPVRNGLCGGLTDAGADPDCARCISVSEICDLRDNDCDTLADEEDPEGNQPCSVPFAEGQCAVGTTHCRTGRIVCEPNYQPQNEVCNGLDDNCNGSTDEIGLQQCIVTSQPAGSPCANGQLVCSGGTPRCVQTIFPREEVCDGSDNDCDGAVDDVTSSPIGQPCGDGGVYACETGIIRCSG